MKRAGLLVLTSLVSVALLCGGVFSQDWPQWRGPNRDARVADFKPPASWPAKLNQKWQVKIGLGDASPALVGDKIYAFARDGGDEVTICFDMTGKELWRDKYAAPAISGAAARAHAGPRSSPVVADGKLVTLGVNGVLSCLDVTGKEPKVLWRNEDYKGVPKFFAAMSPLVYDGVVVAHLGGPDKGTLVALNLADGKDKWKLDTDGPSYSSPVLVTADGVKQVVTMTDKSIIGVSAADGKLLWQLPFAPKGMAYNAATPIVDGQTVIYTGQGRGTKAVKIEKQGDKFEAKELWSNDKLGTQFSSPVLKDGRLYGISDKGSIFCMDAKEGKELWVDSVNRGNYGGMIDAGSVLMALPAKSELVVFKPSEKEYSEVAKIKVAEAETYAYPVLSDNKLLIKDTENLTLWTFE